MVRIEDVRFWTVFGGIGHVVGQSDGRGALLTLCGSMMLNSVSVDRPKRICRKCRARLKDPKLRQVRPSPANLADESKGEAAVR